MSYYERKIVAYPEILDGISMRRVGGPDEMIVVEVCSLRQGLYQTDRVRNVL